MKAILAVNNLGYVGLNYGLPWYCPEDFKHFKELTKESVVLVGYNTFKTLPPLKQREIWVDEFTSITHPSLKYIDWCIGGKATYEKYASLFKELHISHIDNNTIGDTMFPDLKNLSSDCKIFNYYFK